ncbi:MAG: cyclic nucleotide-binding domain-containing protein [Gammaproteobacteria bacterium]|nr:cyclic nucleotide-binding domain-containing protein [Gammaproteobacteria bacterium]
MQQNKPTESDGVLKALGQRLLLVRDLSDPHRQQILAAAELQSHRAGALFCADKRDHEWVHYLVAGAVIATGSDRSVREQEGSPTGALDVFHGLGRINLNVRAKTDVTELRIPTTVLSRFVNVTQAISAVSLPDVVELGLTEGGDGLELALSIGVLSSLPAHDIQRLLQRVVEMPVRAGEIIIEQDQRADCCYIVKAGVAEVDVERHGGTQARVAFKGPGDFFGEEALLLRGPRRATVRMRSDGALLRITEDDFWKLIAPSYLREVTRAQADEMVSAGAVWLDMREPAEFQHGSLPAAINLPEGILRLRCTSLDPRQRYVVCSRNPRQSVLGNFLLSAAGLHASYLVDAIGALEATSRLPYAHEIEQGPDTEPLPASLQLDNDDPAVTAETLPGTSTADISADDMLAIGVEDIRAAERLRYQRRLRKVAAHLIAEGDARVRAAVQEVEMSYLTELENKHRQVLDLKRTVALQHRELSRIRKAAAAVNDEIPHTEQ